MELRVTGEGQRRDVGSAHGDPRERALVVDDEEEVVHGRVALDECADPRRQE